MTRAVPFLGYTRITEMINSKNKEVQLYVVTFTYIKGSRLLHAHLSVTMYRTFPEESYMTSNPYA